MKEYRKNELKNYVIGNILIIMMLSGVINFIYNNLGRNLDDLKNLVSVVLNSALFSSVLYIYVYIFDSVITSRFKETIIYFICGRPGDTIFEKILEPEIDARFTVNEVNEKYKDIYTELNQISDIKQKRHFQNSKWYKIYQSLEKDEMVRMSQQDFLLNRDMCSISIVILVLYIIFSLLSSFYTIRISVIAWVVVEIIITQIAAMNKARRFAMNVIAKDVHRGKNASS